VFSAQREPAAWKIDKAAEFLRFAQDETLRRVWTGDQLRTEDTPTHE